MAELYTRVSEEYAEITRDWKKGLLRNLLDVEDFYDNADVALGGCRQFCENGAEDFYIDSRENRFSTEDFRESKHMENLLADVKEAENLLAKLMSKIDSIGDVLRDTEFFYSEDLSNWYDEQHQYDYERA